MTLLKMKPTIKKRAIRRLKIIAGQVRGLERMIEREEYCIKIIYQSQAIKEALSGIENLILENHLSTHILEQIAANQKNKAIQEILSIYKLSRKKK